MLGWKEDGRKTLLLHVKCQESGLKGPEQPLGACLHRPVSTGLSPLSTAAQVESRCVHRQITPIVDVADKLGRAASL